MQPETIGSIWSIDQEADIQKANSYQYQLDRKTSKLWRTL